MCGAASSKPCCKKAAMCVATGDPHYTTFDGKYFDFYGLGCYYLLKTPQITIQTKLEQVCSMLALHRLSSALRHALCRSTSGSTLHRITPRFRSRLAPARL